MPEKLIRATTTIDFIATKIILLRGEKVLLDTDLAQLYGVQTKALKQAVRRNRERFPQDFLFELSSEEWNFLRSQSVTLEKGRGKYSKYNLLNIKSNDLFKFKPLCQNHQAVR